MSQIKPFQILRIKPLIPVLCVSLNSIVVYPNPLVWVTERHVDSQIVVQSVVVWGQRELGESGVVDVELGRVGAEDEPEHKYDDAEDD
ncbi:hypothetical protein HanIR_Chr14g0693021 [Helianthus annuus]|nr:hypothetical protein HanIR_Chr14g0693021 [Helianthus annuus]